MRRLKIQWNNEMVFLIVSVLYGLGTSFLSEGYIQAYMLDLGMSVQQIGLYGTLGNVGALSSYALFSFYKPKNNDYMTPMFVMALGITILPILLAVMSFVPQLAVILLLASAVHSFALGFRTSCDYCVVPTIMPRAHYGNLSGKCGMIGSGLAALVSAVSASLMAGADAMSGYMTIFMSAAAALLLSATAIRFYKPTMPSEGVAKKEKGRGRLFSKRTAWILLPHLLRGIATGGFYYFVVVSMQRVTLSASGSSLIVTIGVVGAMVGCVIFMFLDKRMKTGQITLIGNLIAGLCAVLTAFNTVPALFFVLYFGYMVFLNVSAYAIPAGVVYSVPADELPFISSMRMLMMSAGSMVFIQVFSLLMTVLPSWTVMAAAAAVYAAAGVVFKIQYTDALKS